MSRLVKKVDLSPIYLMNEKELNPELTQALGEIMKKLYDYEEAEENGLLLHLPCKVGDTVYSVSFKKKCAETEENGGYLIDDELVCLSCGRVYSCESRREYFVEEIAATLPIIENIVRHKNNKFDDFSIYLTREEAEKKLKEMEYKANTKMKDCSFVKECVSKGLGEPMQKNGKCAGYQKSDIDDEPCERCKNCELNEFYEED